MNTDFERIAHSTTGWINAQDEGASGSEFEATGRISGGSNVLEVVDAGDFKVGQEVSVSGCHRYFYGTVYNDREPYFARNQKKLESEIEIRALEPESLWQTFLINFDRTDPVTFRWMAVDPAYQTLTLTEPVILRRWCWQGENIAIGTDWIKLCDGVEIRFNKLDWLPGQSISFHSRNRLLTHVKELDGNRIVLADKASATAENCVIKHIDQKALQGALDRAVRENKGLFIPAGRYRLTTGLWLRNVTARIEGLHRDKTIIDISDEHTAAFWISGGREVAIKSLALEGHTGFMELPANTHFPTATGFPYWPTANQQMEIKGCAAANFVGTEHILFEDIKVRRMASEALYSHGSERYGLPAYIQAPHEGHEGLNEQYTKSCVYHRCHVYDCGFNAFNNNDHAENTSILHCRVERATNFCENASRFTRIIGNTAIDGCATSVHGGGGRLLDPHRIGPTQAIIANNVFEAGRLSGGLSVGNHAGQVIIANNIFVGYSKESAIFVRGGRRINIVGNQIDMSRLDDNPDHERCAISLETSGVIIADNQIFVRGERSKKVTAIHIADHATNLHIHNNIIENCEFGLRSGRRVYVREPEPAQFKYLPTESEVAEAVSDTVFIDSDLPVLSDDYNPYSGWKLRWTSGMNKDRIVEIASYANSEKRLTLAEPLQVTKGDRFMVFPRNANWQIHHNTLTGCGKAIELHNPGSDNRLIADNLVEE